MHGSSSLIFLAFSLCASFLSLSATPFLVDSLNMPGANIYAGEMNKQGRPLISPKPRAAPGPSRLSSQRRDASESSVRATLCEKSDNGQNPASDERGTALQWNIPFDVPLAFKSKPPQVHGINAAQGILMREKLTSLPKYLLLATAEPETQQAGSAILKDKIRSMFAKAEMPKMEELTSKKPEGVYTFPREDELPVRVLGSEEENLTPTHLLIKYGTRERWMSEEELMNFFEPLEKWIFYSHSALLKKLQVSRETGKNMHKELMTWFSELIFTRDDISTLDFIAGKLGKENYNHDSNSVRLQRQVRLNTLNGKKIQHPSDFNCCN